MNVKEITTIWKQLVTLKCAKNIKVKGYAFIAEPSSSWKQGYRLKVVSEKERMEKILGYKEKLTDILVKSESEKNRNPHYAENVHYIDESLKIIEGLLND